MFGRQVSIRTKFILAVALAILVAQIVVAGVMIWQEASLYARSKQETMLATAQSIAAAVSGPARARDANAAFRALRAIGHIPGASYVRVEDRDGRALAESGQAEQLASDVIESERGKDIDRMRLISARTLEVAVPVVESGEKVGRLVLVGDISDLPDRLLSALSLMAWGALGALSLAILIALRMLGPMTRPLTDLAAAMTRVGASHDYGVSMTSTRRDEIGVLMRGFDRMIGEIRQRNAELARHRDVLEQQVADRTADYRNAMELAEQANRSKSDFLATMSHEIRTPMNGVLVMAELLAASDLPPRARKNADVIVRSGQTLLAVINDILDFSKIEAGKLEVETLPVDPVEAVEDVLRLFGDRARSRGLDLADIVRIPRGVQVDADPVRISQVLSNLVNNALKFTEAGGVAVEIDPDPEGSARVRFCVVDTGIGIPEDKLDGIFGAFTQADQSTTRKFGGTGLGLAIARRLVAAMGGELCVKSSAGQGARFFFSLPVSSASAPVMAPRLPAADTATAVLRIDSAGARAQLELALQAAGFVVSACAAGQLAEAAKGARLVFADLEDLPGRDRLPVDSSGAIVAIAGMGEASERPVREGRADRILQRPLAKTDIDAIVDAVVEGRSLAVANTAPLRSDLPHFANVRILVVDDGAVNREVAAEALMRLGVTADLAVDGRQAVAFVENASYDLVLMDGSMPVMDGYEATRAIRARELETGRQRLKIVALTAHVIGAGAEAWRDSGMDGVLHKPFTLSAMARCLAEHLSSEAVGEAPAPIERAEPAVGVAGLVDPAVLEGLREMSGGDTATVARIVGLYRTHAPQSVAVIAAAFAERDREALATASHALKSMSANIGARAVASAAQAIERACRLELRLPDPSDVDIIPGLVAETCEAIMQMAAPAEGEPEFRQARGSRP